MEVNSQKRISFAWLNPHSELFFGHIIVLLLISIVQFSLFPNLLIPFQPDIITIWVTLIAITRPYQISILFACIAGLVYETHTTIPMGQMICIYLLMASTIRMARSSLSWRTRKPWFFCVIGVTVIVAMTEMIVLVSENQWMRFDFTYISSLLFRVFFACLCASLLPKHILYLNQSKEEPL